MIGKILGQVDSQTKRTCFQATEDCIQAVMRFCYLTDANEDEHHAAFVNANRGKFDASNYKQLANTALVVDGTCLEGIWADPSLQQLFIEAARLVPTVIACRVSPLQKATLVRMVKTAPGHPITLAIGDGANDVAMIHEARVGVGISGREGKHAANSSDFSIGQFRFLIPLLLEHGRYNYIRSSKLILYSFFKNLVLVSTLFYYTIYSAFSGTSQSRTPTTMIGIPR